MREAQEYTYQSLINGFRPGMGQFLPDRMFWARGDEDEDDAGRLEGLYAVTPDTVDSVSLLSQAAAVAPHIDILQYRNKSEDAALRLEQARALADLCRRHGCSSSSTTMWSWRRRRAPMACTWGATTRR